MQNGTLLLCYDWANNEYHINVYTYQLKEHFVISSDECH